MGKEKFVEARIEAVLTAEDPSTFVTERRSAIRVELGGIPGDRHYGLLVAADVRQSFYARGTMIANRRQISIVSAEDCAKIAGNLGVDRIEPEWLGANILLSGYPDFTQLPLGSRLIVPDGAGLICEGENLPCLGPGEEIEAALGTAGLAERFVKAARKLRGIVCSIEREGEIRSGDAIRIFINGGN